MTAAEDDPIPVEVLAARFDALRPRLVRVAHALLGTVADAEDAVADVWPDLVTAHAREPIRDLEAWCVVATSRRALTVLRSARVRRETYVGPWLPEPLHETTQGRPSPSASAAAPSDPADRVTLAESVDYALLVALERLTPAERTSWVLHDLFGVPFDEVADVVGRTPAAVRQAASRARRNVRDSAPRLRIDPTEHRRTVEAFLTAAAGGDVGALVAVLDPAVVLTSDGGGVVNAARRPVHGPDRVARFILGILQRMDAAGATVEEVVAQGAPALLSRIEGRPDSLSILTSREGRIVRVDIVRAPAKLAQFARIGPADAG